LTIRIRNIIESIFNSYPVILFSESKLFAAILIIVSFFDYYAGLGGLIGLVTANITAYYLGFDRYKIRKGYYGFNSLILGMGIAMEFDYSHTILLVIIFTSILVLFFTIAFESSLGKNYLPFLSVPFLFGFWALQLFIRNILLIPLSIRELNYFSELGFLSGDYLKIFFSWITWIHSNVAVRLYFESLSVVFFQRSVITGLLICVGLLISSRISFTLSIIGYSTAYFVLSFLGLSITGFDYSFVGFNSILFAIAVGGYFIIPSRSSYIWVVLLTPIMVIVSLALGYVFKSLNLMIYSLPFNFVVLLFLYILKLRIFKSKGLTETVIQQNSPERNLYSFLNNNYRFKNNRYFSLKLPFYGQWQVSQGHNGKHTHRDKWKYAWDFVIKDNEGRTFKGYGYNLEDYYCYNKAVLAPADGVVHEIIDGIPDNRITQVNLEQNWGNIMIIKHSDIFYTQLSHLKQGSFRVKQGDFVKAGQIVASCGSSGRSPEPHLHFQVQSVPVVGAQTIDYPFSHYVLAGSNNSLLKSFESPEEDDKISNLEINSLISKSFDLTPGKKLLFKTDDKRKRRKEIEWEVVTDIYNYSYIWCKKSNSFAYFRKNGSIFYFYHFKGSKRSLLYYFFLALYKVPLGCTSNLHANDSIAADLFMNKIVLFFQDFIAPFKIFNRSDFTLQFNDEDVNHNEIKFTTGVVNRIFGIKIKEYNFQITINSSGINRFCVNTGNKKLNALCIEQQQ
jgi:urea transporter